MPITKTQKTKHLDIAVKAQWKLYIHRREQAVIAQDKERAALKRLRKLQMEYDDAWNQKGE